MLLTTSFSCLGFLFLFLLFAPGEKKEDSGVIGLFKKLGNVFAPGEDKQVSRWDRYLQTSQITDGMDGETKLRRIESGLLAASDVVGNQRDELKGMEPTVVVDVAVSGDYLEASGLSENQLMTDLKIRLWNSGITVADQATGASGMFFADIAAVKAKDMPVYAVYVMVRYLDLVLITNRKPGNPTIFGPATLWSDGRILVLRKQQIDVARQNLQELVDRFANDYLASNLLDQPRD